MADRKRGKTTSGMDRPGVCQVSEGSGEQRKMEEAGCEVIYCVPKTATVEGQVVKEGEVSLYKETNSFVPGPYKLLGDMEGQGRILDIAVGEEWCCMLHVVWHCRVEVVPYNS